MEPSTERARILRPVDVIPPAATVLLALCGFVVGAPLPLGSDALRAWAEIAVVFGLLVIAPAVIERSELSERARVYAGYGIFLAFAAFIVTTPTVGRPFDPLVIGVAALAAALLGVLDRLKPGFSPLPFLHAWSALILAGMAYGNLGAIMPPPWRVFDDPLARVDHAIFGTQLSLAIEPWSAGFWNDWFSFHYALYIAYPIAIGFVYYALGRREEFDRLFLRVSLSLWLGNVFYLLMPAAGPRLHLLSSYRGPLVGGALTHFQEGLVGGYGYHYDCFPSLHTACSLLAVFSLRRQFPRVFPVVLFFEANLILSTVWLRQHWAIDVLAGIAFAIAVHVASTAIERVDLRRAVPAR